MGESGNMSDSGISEGSNAYSNEPDELKDVFEEDEKENDDVFALSKG